MAPSRPLTAPGEAPSAGQEAAGQIASAVAEINAERVVIDPPAIGGMHEVSSTSEFVASLLRSTLERTHCTTLISGQRLRGATGFTRLGVEEQIVDGIIDLGFMVQDGRRMRVAAVHSMHGTRTNLDDPPVRDPPRPRRRRRRELGRPARR